MTEITKENCESLAQRIRSAATIEEAGEIVGDIQEAASTRVILLAVNATARMCAKIAHKLPHHNGQRVGNAIYEFYSLAYEKDVGKEKPRA